MLKYILLSIIVSFVCTNCVTVFGGIGETPVFRNDYTFLERGQSFYKVHKLRLNFSDSVATCKAEGAELWVPNSNEDIVAVVNITKKNVELMWIGAHDIFAEGDFVTLDGKALEDIYTNWGTNEPNNVNNNENCVVVGRDGFYNDVSCDSKYNLICRRSAQGLTQNPACETYDIKYFYKPELDKCYKVHTTPMTWREAFKVCRSELSNLVIIDSEQEAKFLSKEFSKYPEEKLTGVNIDKGVIHIGFNDLINHGIYLTTDGKPLSESGYEVWADGQPDNAFQGEHCGSMTRQGKLNDIGCEIRALFICEKALTFSEQEFRPSSPPGLPDAK